MVDAVKQRDNRPHLELPRRPVQRIVQLRRFHCDPKHVNWNRDPSHKLLDKVSVAVTRGRRCFRALRPVSPEDSRLFQALLDGKFLIQGIRNKELRQLLFPAAAEPLHERKLASRITRWLQLLKSHNLISSDRVQERARFNP